MTLVVTSTPVADDRPLPLLAPVADALLWLRGTDGMAAWGRALAIEVGTGPERADRIRDRVAGLAIDGDPGDLRVFISLAFDHGAARSRAVIPRRILVRTDGVTRLVSIAPADVSHEEATDDVPAPGDGPTPRPHHGRIRYAGSSLPDMGWLEAVAAAIRRIGDGDAEKVVLARDHAVWCHDTFDARHLALQLSARFPGCWTFHHTGLVGATPELLLARSGLAIRSLVLAGTARRDPDPIVDAQLGQELLDSDKDRREHDLAVTSVSEVLADIVADIAVPASPSLLDLDNVRHLATDVTATLRDDLWAVQIADRLHPTAAVGGTPRAAALAMIRELEGMDRDRYAAPVGWMDATGDGEFGLALRCARLSGARARLFAGVGIVAGSLPEDELSETRLKLRAMQQALEG